VIDLGSLLDGDEVLAGTARPPLVRIGKDLAEALGVADGEVTVSTDRGAHHAAGRDHRPAPQVVWLPRTRRVDRASQPRRHSGAVVRFRRRRAILAGLGGSAHCEPRSRGQPHERDPRAAEDPDAAAFETTSGGSR
jgi:NADH-quinone oxidoreductase subunit G